MICRCFSKTLDIGAWGSAARRTALLMLRVPDYEAYVEHLRVAHPGRTPLARDAFFLARQDAGMDTLRCC